MSKTVMTIIECSDEVNAFIDKLDKIFGDTDGLTAHKALSIYLGIGISSAPLGVQEVLVNESARIMRDTISKTVLGNA